MLFTISDSTFTRKPSVYCVKTAAGQIVEEGTLAGGAYGVAGWASSAETSLAWSDGGDPLQCLDLRHAEALCPATCRWAIRPR